MIQPATKIDLKHYDRAWRRKGLIFPQSRSVYICQEADRSEIVQKAGISNQIYMLDTRDIEPQLVQCRANVFNVGPTYYTRFYNRSNHCFEK